MPRRVPATVVHVITSLELGGAQRNTLYTVSHLDPRRFRAALVSGPGGVLDDEARALGVPWCVVPALGRAIRPVDELAALRGIRGALLELHGQNRGALVVHTHSSKAGILGRVAARAAGASAVVHTVHGFGFHDGQAAPARLALQGVERLMSGLTDAWVFVSRRDFETAERLHLVGPGAGRLIRSGIALGAFGPNTRARRRIRAQLRIPHDAPVVVTVANFKAQKAPLMGVEAFARVARAFPAAHWVYAGDGPLRASVEQAIGRHGLQDRVHLLGWRDDVVALLAAADVCMLSSHHEGLPRSVLEALATGLPVAATDAGGTGEVVLDDVGRIVPTGDAHALGDAVADLLRKPPVDVRERAAGVLAEFDIDEMVRRQEELYQDLLDRRDTGRARPRSAPT